jgi:Tol biopolymer transport system component
VLAFAIASVDCGSDHHNLATNQFAFVSEAATGTALSAVQRHSSMHHVSSRHRDHGPLQSAGLKPWLEGFPVGTDSVTLMNNDGSGKVVIAAEGAWIYSAQEGYDGKKGVATVQDNNGYYQIVYVDLRDQNNPVLTQLTTEAVDHWSPQLSWDGTKVVYMKYGSDTGYDQVVLMSTSGGAETVLATDFNASYPTFTADGKILFGNGDHETICIMSADGTGITQLTTPDAGQSDYMPSVSPDGKTITFDRYNSAQGTDDIWTANIDGSNAKQITTDGMNWDPMFVNKRIVFLSWRDGGGNDQVYSVNPDGTNQQALTTDVNAHYFDWH